MKCQLRDQTEKDNGFYCGCSLSPYTPPYTPPHIPLYSEERQLLCFKLSCKSSPCLWPTVCKDLRPVNSHRNEFESRSLPGWAFRWLSPWCSFVRDPEPEAPSCTPGFLTHGSCEIMHTLCLKVLSFRVICCTVVNNKYNITSSFLVTMI